MINNKNKYIYYFFTIFFIFITTNYFNDTELINTWGQKDIEQYYMLAELAPSLPKGDDAILAHVSSRYLIPYLVGNISNFANLELFLSFKIINILFFILFLTCLSFLIKEVPFSEKEKILFFSLILLNPYVVRHHLFQPVQTHDLLFFTLSMIFLIGILKNNFKYIFFSTMLMIFIRQTSIAFLIGGIIFFIFDKNKNYLKVVLFLLLFLMLFKVNSLIGNYISPNNFDMNYAFGILFFDFSKIDKLLRFLALPLVSFFPLLIMIFSSRKIKDNFNLTISITCFAIIVLMIGQPVMGGPDYTQRNVVRISSLCFIVATFFTINTFKHNFLLKNNFLYYSFILGLFFWSLHPLYSKFDIFSFLRF